MFPIREATLWNMYWRIENLGDRTYAAKNPEYGTYINFSLEKDAKSPIKVDIIDNDGSLVTSLQMENAKRGINRLVWDLGYDAAVTLENKIKEGFSSDEIRPKVVPGEYTASWDNCCRNAAIINLPNASSADMQLFTDFTVDLIDSYSTPFFMVSPVVFLPMNTPWQYNPLPFDNDGDSLVWSLEFPHESSTSNPSHGTPIAGYSNPPSVAGGQFSINPITGTISWTASTIGNFVYTVTCEEFRNGNKVGEIRRDMQFIVLPSGPVPQLIDIGSLPLNADGVPYVNAIAGDPFSLNLFALDSSVSSIGFHAFGEPFDLSNPMTYTQGSMDNFQTKVSLMWSPSINEARPDPYAVVLRLSLIHI